MGLINAIIQHCNNQTTITPSETLADILLIHIKQFMGYSIKLDTTMHKTIYKMHVLYTIATNLLRPADLYLFMSRVDKGEIILPNFKIQDVELFENEVDFAM